MTALPRLFCLVSATDDHSLLPALADAKEHDAVVALLFNLALESPPDFSEAEWTPWRDELDRKRRAVDGPQARSLATLAMWRAQQAWQKRDVEGANAAVAEALQLLREGKGRIATVEQVYVLAVAAQLRGMQGGYAEGSQLADEAVKLLPAPRSMLPSAQIRPTSRIARLDSATANDTA